MMARLGRDRMPAIEWFTLGVLVVLFCTGVIVIYLPYISPVTDRQCWSV